MYLIYCYFLFYFSAIFKWLFLLDRAWFIFLIQSKSFIVLNPPIITWLPES